MNTCSVTADAEAAARQAIRRAAREHPGARIVAAGCCAELRPDVARGAARASPRWSGRALAGAVAGGAGAAAGRRGRGGGGRAGRAPARRRGAGRPRARARHTRPFLKVQDGCDAALQPTASSRWRAARRARSRSTRRSRGSRALGARHAEVVLTGVHLGAWGRDLSPRRSLADARRARRRARRAVGAAPPLLDRADELPARAPRRAGGRGGPLRALPPARSRAASRARPRGDAAAVRRRTLPPGRRGGRRAPSRAPASGPTSSSGSRARPRTSTAPPWRSSSRCRSRTCTSSRSRRGPGTRGRGARRSGCPPAAVRERVGGAARALRRGGGAPSSRRRSGASSRWWSSGSRAAIARGTARAVRHRPLARPASARRGDVGRACASRRSDGEECAGAAVRPGVSAPISRSGGACLAGARWPTHPACSSPTAASVPDLPLDRTQVARCRALADRDHRPGARRRASATRPSRSSGPCCGSSGSTTPGPRGVPLVNLVVDALHERGLLGRGAAYWFGWALRRGATRSAARWWSGSPRFRARPEPLPADEERALREEVRARGARRGRRAAPRASRRGTRSGRSSGSGRGRTSTSSSPPATSTTTWSRRAPRPRRAPTSSPSSAPPRSRCSTTSRTAPPPRATAAPTRRRRTSASCARRSTRSRAGSGATCTLTNYSSGLCMPEIAFIAAWERLDMLLNDAMYGILFRDINMRRTLVRPVLLAPHLRARRHHHQHRRGQLHHHRRRRRGGPHRHRLPVRERVLRARAPGSRTGSSGSATPSRSTPHREDTLRARAGAGAARPDALPRRAHQVHAAHQAQGGRHLLQPRLRRDGGRGRLGHRPGDPAPGHDDRGDAQPLPDGPVRGAEERPTTSTGRGGRWARSSSSARAASSSGAPTRRSGKALALLEEVARDGLMEAIGRARFGDVARRGGRRQGARRRGRARAGLLQPVPRDPGGRDERAAPALACRSSPSLRSPAAPRARRVAPVQAAPRPGATGWLVYAARATSASRPRRRGARRATTRRVALEAPDGDGAARGLDAGARRSPDERACLAGAEEKLGAAGGRPRAGAPPPDPLRGPLRARPSRRDQGGWHVWAWAACDGGVQYRVFFTAATPGLARRPSRRCADARRERAPRRGGREPTAARVEPGEVVRPYGDRRDDGVVQLSFVLPVPAGERAREAAAELARQARAWSRSTWRTWRRPPSATPSSSSTAGPPSGWTGDRSTCPRWSSAARGFDELNAYALREVGRRIVVLGACTGSDAHAVGHRRHHEHEGVRRRLRPRALPVLRGDEPRRAGGERARSRGSCRSGAPTRCSSRRWSPSATCTRRTRGSSSTSSSGSASAAGVVALLGGPRIDHRLALELGYDAGFGPGTKPSDVANFIVGAVLRRMGKETHMRRDEGRPRGCACPSADAHYGGDLVDGARILALFGDVATELLHPPRRRRGALARLRRGGVPRADARRATTSRSRRSSCRWGTPRGPCASRRAR